MSDNEYGGPAFPQTVDDMGTIRSATSGMTLRDYFAAKAMHGMLAEDAGRYTFSSLAKASYEAADAMLKARDA